MARRPPGIRFRYVAFRVQPAATRADFARALEVAVRSVPGPVTPQLILYREGAGLVRCGHRQKDSVIAALNAITRVGASVAAVRTVGTSGTIRKAREKYLNAKSGSPSIKV